MKHLLCAVLMAAIMTSPAFAAKLYLKSGGYIAAKRVWRADGRVYVLATRDTLTSFDKSEVDLKRTFPRKKRTVKPPEAVAAKPAAVVPGAAAQAPGPQKAADSKAGVTLPGLPKLPEKSPESLVPSSGAGGTIKQSRKAMSEKAGD